jgi:predicted metal-dependent phosphoesterase TrpH
MNIPMNHPGLFETIERDRQTRENLLRRSNELLAVLILRPSKYRRRRAAKAGFGLTAAIQSAHH